MKEKKRLKESENIEKKDGYRWQEKGKMRIIG